MEDKSQNTLVNTLTATSTDVFRSVLALNRAAFTALGVPTHSAESANGDRSSNGSETQARPDRDSRREVEQLMILATSLVHDLQTPLQAAQSNLEMARYDLDEDTDLLDDVAAAHDRLDTLIEDARTLVQEGTVVTETDPVSVETVATEAWTLIDAPDATLTTEPVTIDADRTRLRQLLENLLANSVEHASGDSSVTITVGPTAQGFFVADDGPGIAADATDSVFEHGYSTDGTGMGFGLAIVQAVAHAHDWEVTVTESEGGGARFEFR